MNSYLIYLKNLMIFKINYPLIIIHKLIIFHFNILFYLISDLFVTLNLLKSL